MIETGDLFVFIAALVAVYLLPGPDMALVLSSSVFQSRQNGLMVAVGLALSRALHVCLAGIGLAALLKTHPLLFDAVRWMGATYLCWMAWKILRARDSHPGNDLQGGAAGWQALQRGFLTNMLNPKALMFCALLLPQFISPLGNLFEQYLALGTILVLLGAIFDVFYVFAASGIASRFSGSRTGRKIAQYTFASIFTVAAVRLAIISR
jgi:threonine/homoserine/homoserine lactone efflux protein